MIIVVTRRDQIDAVARAVGLTTSQARDALDAISGVVAAALLEHQRIVVPGLGTFSVQTRRPRRVTNPATGVPMDLPASAVVSFKATPGLRESVREKWS